MYLSEGRNCKSDDIRTRDTGQRGKLEMLLGANGNYADWASTANFWVAVLRTSHPLTGPERDADSCCCGMV